MAISIFHSSFNSKQSFRGKIMMIIIIIHIYFTCHKVRRYKEMDITSSLRSLIVKHNLIKKIFNCFLKIFRLSEKLKSAGRSFQIMGAINCPGELWMQRTLQVKNYIIPKITGC